ncbi:MAG TPA: hypothetical protein VF026_31850 [Ktedonobacteraceae bacterium]
MFDVERFLQYKNVVNVTGCRNVRHSPQLQPGETLRNRGRLKPYKGLQTVIRREGKKPLIAQWGGIPLQRRMGLPLNDILSPYWDARTELVQRLLADTCELCGSHRDIEVHHIRALKDLKRYGRPEKPAWVKTMAARHRKTLVVCRSCHKDIHQGQPLKHHPHSNDVLPESRMN